MKKLILLFHFILGVFRFAFSQTAPGLEWQNTIGGSNNDQLYSIQQTLDGGYILGGWSPSNISGDKTENSNGSTDYWIIKTDSNGIIQWQNTIGGIGDEGLTSIQQTTDGGYFLSGHSNSSISGDKTENSMFIDYWIVKTDSSGNIQMQNTIGGNDIDWLYTAQQTADGGYILGGESTSGLTGDKTEYSIGGFDYWIVKIDATGNIQWQNTIGGNYEDRLQSIKQTSDGGYILGGYSNSNISGDKTENNWDPTLNTQDYWLIKTDSLGVIQWQNTIGGNYEDILKSIDETSDKGYILGGYSRSSISGNKTESNLGGYDYWIVKTDSIGNILWQNTIGGSGDDFLQSIHQTIDGGFIIGGYSESNISGDKTEPSNGIFDYWIVKTNAAGNIQWQNTIGGGSSDFLYSIQQTADGGFILGGESYSNLSGDKTENSLGSSDYWIVKLYPDTTTGIPNIQSSTSNIQLYPNPAQDQITINLPSALAHGAAVLTVFDMLGNQVFKQSISNQTSHILNLKSFPPGVYSVQVSNGTQTALSRFVKM